MPTLSAWRVKGEHFKHGLIDTNGMLSSWKNQNNSDCCRWRGVQCSNLMNHIIKLDLHGTSEQSLSGKINGPSLQELSYLNYLDLSYNDFSDGPIPKHIGSLINLNYLNLSSCHFDGAIPSNLGNLSTLYVLDLSGNLLDTGSLAWLSYLSSLRHIDMSSIYLSRARGWDRVISKLPHLKVLKLRGCLLREPIPPFNFDFNFSAPLQVLDLSGNLFTSSIFQWLSNFGTSLIQLDLSDNSLQGYIPNVFGKMIALTHVKFQGNEIEGVSPKSFENLCNLRSLSFVENKLQGSFLNFLQTFSKCTLNSLQFLRLSSNNLSGVLPDFTLLPILKGLDLSANKLNGTIPLSLGQSLHLEFLDLAQNSFEGLIFEAHFSKLTKLRDVVLAENSLVFDVQFNWVPCFQLNSILLKSCKLGPQFPNWLRTQNFSYLDISNASISDIIPPWFWNLSPRLKLLDLSHNNLRGEIPTSSVKFIGEPGIFLSTNDFEGQIPTFISQAGVADVSDNKFSAITFLCRITNTASIWFLDISTNKLSGDLPNCWENMSNLKFLSLADNNISGNLPSSLSNLRLLQSLHLHKNSFSGDLPSWLKKTSSLNVLNLASNYISGKIPSWFGDGLPNLVLLSLRSNNFYGDLPLSLCNLRYIQVLDLSLNKFTGSIPNCLDNFMLLKSKSPSMFGIPYAMPIDVGYDMSSLTSNIPLVKIKQSDNMVVTWKGGEYSYGKNLFLLKSIDLSGNYLAGNIPNKIINLVGLVSLNLSRNNLTGKIPKKIGLLTSLNALDLSRNKLVGHIPASLAEINFLSTLDLSCNQFSGKIPTGTQLQSFDASVYIGNLGLCGSPLPLCPGDEANSLPYPWNNNDNKVKNREEFLTLGFYLSMAAGYIIGFWLTCGSLIFHTKWRHAYFKFVESLNEWFHVEITILQRLLRSKWYNLFSL